MICIADYLLAQNSRPFNSLRYHRFAAPARHLASPIILTGAVAAANGFAQRCCPVLFTQTGILCGIGGECYVQGALVCVSAGGGWGKIAVGQPEGRIARAGRPRLVHRDRATPPAFPMAFA